MVHWAGLGSSWAVTFLGHVQGTHPCLLQARSCFSEQVTVAQALCPTSSHWDDSHWCPLGQVSGPPSSLSSRPLWPWAPDSWIGLHLAALVQQVPPSQEYEVREQFLAGF